MILEDPNDPYFDLFRKKIKKSQKKNAQWRINFYRILIYMQILNF